MGRPTRRWLRWVLAGVVAAGWGCSREDTDRLSRVGRKAAARAEAVTGGAGGKLALGWQALNADVDGLAPDARISARLRWDRSLADNPIRVYAREGEVELTGTVRDLKQRRRAVELAETTVGVERVKDSLELAP